MLSIRRRRDIHSPCDALTSPGGRHALQKKTHSIRYTPVKAHRKVHGASYQFHFYIFFVFCLKDQTPKLHVAGSPCRSVAMATRSLMMSWRRTCREGEARYPGSMGEHHHLCVSVDKGRQADVAGGGKKRERGGAVSEQNLDPLECPILSQYFKAPMLFTPAATLIIIKACK